MSGGQGHVQFLALGQLGAFFCGVLSLAVLCPQLAYAQSTLSGPESPNDIGGTTESDPLHECVSAHAIARQAVEEQLPLKARAQLRQCASSGCPIAIRSECSDWLKLAELQVPTVIPAASGETGDVDVARVFIDGQRIAERLDGHPLEVTPGPHEFAIELPDGQRKELRIVVGVGEKDRVIRADFRQPHQASAPRTVERSNPAPVQVHGAIEPSLSRREFSLLLGALSVGSAVAAGSLMYVGIRERNEAYADCHTLCSHSRVRGIRRWFIMADVAGTVATVTGGMGVYFFFSGESKAAAPSAGVTWQGTF